MIHNLYISNCVQSPEDDQYYLKGFRPRLTIPLKFKCFAFFCGNVLDATEAFLYMNEA